jgi:hypothetical protein
MGKIIEVRCNRPQKHVNEVHPGAATSLVRAQEIASLHSQ